MQAENIFAEQGIIVFIKIINITGKLINYLKFCLPKINY